MNVTSKISVDLTRRNIGAKVDAVQGDGNTRYVEITLLADGKPWTVPPGVDVAISYCRHPYGPRGLYDLLADGTAAISISGNVATVILAPQMLTVSGTVQATLVFNDAQLNRLTTFPFSVIVASNPAAGAQKTEDYIRLQWLEDKLTEYLAEIKASGAFDGRPGDPGRDYDHSPEFTALAAEMAGYQQQVAEDRQQIADAAAAVDASAKAAAGSAGIAAGAQQAAEGAATAAAKSAEDAERYAEESQLAVDSLRPVFSQIKNDLSDKLPKSPANWEPWTAEEQAAARTRMGIQEPVLLEQIVLSDEVSSFERSACADGTPYNLKEIYIYITLGDCSQYETRGSFAARIGNGIFIRSNADDIAKTTAAQSALIYVSMYRKNDSWIGEFDYHVFAQYPSSKHYFYTKFEENPDSIKRIFLSFNSGFLFPAGSVIKIYGVRA